LDRDRYLGIEKMVLGEGARKRDGMRGKRGVRCGDYSVMGT
jgi:hypothetical protein